MDTGISIFNQLCEVNDLDPDQVRNIAAKQQMKGTEEAERLIRTAFYYKASLLVNALDLGSTTRNETISEGQEYSISADPAAPSFTINEDFIHSKYSEVEANKLIEALGKVMLPIRA